MKEEKPWSDMNEEELKQARARVKKRGDKHYNTSKDGT